MDIEIISKEEIKPEFPTPHHLRTYRISVIDQLLPHQYTNLLFFFSPDNPSSVVNDINLAERRKCLKQSLSKSLASFYPVAGKMKDDMHIDCNDDGVYYVEAQVHFRLPEFLRKPENQIINQLLPYHPDSPEILSKTYLLMVQISDFDCGGVAIGLNTSHKIFDGLSISIFMNAWGAAARKSSQQINPSFISPSLFPPIPDLLKDSSINLSNQPLNEPHYATRRFVFDRRALDALRTAAATSALVKPSSVTAVMGLLWKSFMAALKARCGTVEKSILSIPVNLRTRCSPPLPPNSFGNIFWEACTHQSAELDDYNQELHLLVNHIRNIIASIDQEFIEAMRGADMIHKVMELLKHNVELQSKPGHICFSSLCKMGYYEIDFGWGKPIWTCMGRGSKDLYGWGNFVHLIDTKSGDGIEAWVTMREDLMAIFERMPELTTYEYIVTHSSAHLLTSV